METKEKKTSEYTIYIDESGDLGINKGTRWFVISAVIVKKTDEPSIRATIQNLRNKYSVKEIHLKKIRDHFKRAYIARELSTENFIYTNVIIDTNKFTLANIPDANTAYNYTCKYLLQRVSWYLKEINSTADIILSARGTSKDGELIEYIEKKLLPGMKSGVSLKRFNKIKAKPAGDFDILQLADVCATTMFYKHNENPDGFTVPCYAKALEDHLYKKNGEIDSYGIKYFNLRMKPTQEELLKNCVCTKKERSPGTATAQLKKS